MKKIFSVFLVFLVMLFSATPVFAKTLEYNDIEKEVLANNLQVKSNKATLQNLKLNRPAVNSGLDMDKAMESTIEGIDRIVENPAVLPETVVVAQSTKMSLTMLYELLGSMNSGQGTGYSQQLNLTKLKLEHADKQIVSATKGIFASYNQLVLNLESLNANKESMALSLNAVKVRESLGLATKLEVSEQEKNYNSFVNSISELESQVKMLKGELNKMLGRSFDDELTVGKLPAPDIDYIAKIDLEKDFITAKQNSYDIKCLNLEYKHLSKDDYTVANNNRMIKRNEIKSAEESLFTSLTQKYNDILKQKASFEAEGKKYSDEAKKYSDVEKKYTLGRASGMEVKLQKNALKAQEMALKTAENNLFSAIESYRELLNGISV